MSKKLPLIIVLGLLAVMLGVFIYIRQTYYPKYKWNADYRKSSAEPYGLKFLYNIIKDGEQKTTVIYNRALHVLDTNATGANFIAIGSGLEIDSIAAAQLYDFAAKGNRVLISTDNAPLELLKLFVPIGEHIYNYLAIPDSNVNITFSHKKRFPEKLHFHYQFYKHKSKMYWQSYRQSYFNTSLSDFGFEAISMLNDTTVNGFYVQCGDGLIVVHANPILFTNYCFITPDGLKHANNYLSFLHTKGPTYWYDDQGTPPADFAEPRKNPLKLLFSHPYLQWGWYLLLITVLLYLIFRSKREQRVIPLLPVNTNSSIEYTKAIGILYYRSKKHHFLVNELNTIFLAEIRSRYNIRTDLPQQELAEQIAQRSGVKKENVSYLLKQFKFLKNWTDADASELQDLFTHIEEFNKTRK